MNPSKGIDAQLWGILCAQWVQLLDLMCATSSEEAIKADTVPFSIVPSTKFTHNEWSCCQTYKQIR